MYKEVALDPECLAEFHYYGLLKTDFGFEQGRYLIAPVKLWVKEAVNAVKRSNMPPIRQKSVKAYLNKLQRHNKESHIVLPQDRASIDRDHCYRDWREWVVLQHQYRSFNAVIAEKGILESMNYDDILDGDERWDVAPTLWIDKTPDQIISAITPLLFLSEELIIVDQFFHFANNLVLQKILYSLQVKPTIKKILIVTSIDTANPQSVYEQEFISRFAYLPTIEILNVPVRHFHDRYMITERATIKAGHGFGFSPMRGTQADRVSISLCSEEESNETRQFVEHFLTEHPEQHIRFELTELE